MNKTFQTHKKPFIMGIEFKSNQPVMVKVEAYDKLSPTTFYCKRQVKIDGSNKFKIKLPTTPASLVFLIYPASYANYKDYIVFGKTQPKKFEIVKTEELTLEKGSAVSRFIQSFAEDAQIIN